MTDPVSATIAALAARSPAALGFAFAAGVLTSVGPCVAPRYVAVAAIVNGAARPRAATASYIAGVVGAFIAVGFLAGAVGTLWAISSTVYALLGGGLMIGGGIALVRAEPHRSAGHACGPARSTDAGLSRSLGGIFLLGAASAFVISPCCTPVVAAIVSMSTAMGEPLIGVLLLLCFGCGHALPLFFTGQLAAIAERLFCRRVAGQAPAIVGAVLMLALGAYYAVLA